MNDMKRLIQSSLFYYFFMKVRNSFKESFFLNFQVRLAGEKDVLVGTEGPSSFFIDLWKKVDRSLNVMESKAFKHYQGSLLQGMVNFFKQKLYNSCFGKKAQSYLGQDSLFVLLALLPIGYIYIDFFVRDIVGFNLLASIWDELAILALCALLVLRRIEEKGEYRSNYNRLSLVVFAYILVGLLHLLAKAPYPSIGVEGFRAVFQQVFWFFILVEIIRTKNEGVFVLKAFNLLGLSLACHAIYQFIFRVQPLGNWTDTSEAIGTRAFAITTSPNILGSLFVMMIPISLGLFFYSTTAKSKSFYAVSFLALMLGLLFTYSRGAWLALAFSMLVGSFLMEIKFFFLALLAGLSLLAFVPAISNRLFYVLSPIYLAKASKDGRLFRWQAGIEEWSQDKLFGAGLGNFGGAVAMNNFPNRFYIDNYYLKTLAEMGYVGFFALVFVLAACIIESLKVIAEQTLKEDKILLIAVFVGILGLIAHNVVENIFEVPAMMIYFWTMMTVVETFRKKQRGRA